MVILDGIVLVDLLKNRKDLERQLVMAEVRRVVNKTTKVTNKNPIQTVKNFS